MRPSRRPAGPGAAHVDARAGDGDRRRGVEPQPEQRLLAVEADRARRPGTRRHTPRPRSRAAPAPPPGRGPARGSSAPRSRRSAGRRARERRAGPRPPTAPRRRRRACGAREARAGARASRRPPRPSAIARAAAASGQGERGVPVADGASTAPGLARAIRASPMSRSRALGSRSRQRSSSAAEARRGRWRGAHPGDRLLDDRGQDVRDRLAVEEPAAGQHLEQHDAEGPDVGALVDGLAPRLLGRHVGGGPEDQAGRGAGAGQGRRLRQGGRAAGERVVVSAPGLGEAEVEDLDLALRGELDVRGLEVAVHDALLVGLLEGLGDLHARWRPLRRRGSPPASAAPRGPRLPPAP